MGTQTKQDAYISSQLSKSNAAIEMLRQIFLDGRIEKRLYAGATREAQYGKFIEVLGNALELIDRERKKIR